MTVTIGGRKNTLLARTRVRAKKTTYGGVENEVKQRAVYRSLGCKTS